MEHVDAAHAGNDIDSLEATDALLTVEIFSEISFPPTHFKTI